MIISPSNDKRLAAFKRTLEEWIALQREDASSYDLARLYAVSSTVYAASNLRAENVAQVPFRVVDKAGKPVENHPLNPLLRDNPALHDIMLRSELAMCFWGHNLIHKRRMMSGRVFDLSWLNPRIYMNDVTPDDGLLGWRITDRSTRYIPRTDGIYMQGVDFDDDFDGVSPAEAAFDQAGVDAEAAQTAVSFLRNRAVPLAIVQPDAKALEKGGAPSPAAANKLRNLLRTMVQGARNAGRTLVSSEGRWEWLQIQQEFDKVGFEVIYDEARKAVSIAFRVPLDLLLPTASTYAEAYQADAGWIEKWLMPRCRWYGSILTVQLGYEFDGFRESGYKVAPDFTGLIKTDDQAVTTVTNAQVQASYLTLYDAQVRTGNSKPDDRLRDYYLVGGTPVHINDFPKLAERQFGLAGSLAAVLTGQKLPDTRPQLLPPQPPAPVRSELKLLPARSATGTPSAYAVLKLADSPAIQAVQNFLRAVIQPTDGVVWTPPEQFHITLVYAPLMTDEQLAATQAALGESLPTLLLQAGPLGVFKNEQNALHLQVELTPELKSLQQALYKAFADQGVTLSEYSDPSAYKPHITLAYAPADMDVPDFKSSFPLQPVGIELSRADYQSVGTIALRRDSAWLPEDVYKEIRDCARIAARKGSSYTFEPRSLSRLDVAYIRLLAATSDEEYDLVAAARQYVAEHRPAPEAAKAFSDTSATYAATLYDLVRAVFEQRVNRDEFGKLGREEISTAFRQAYLDGLNSSGVQTDTLEPGEAAFIKERSMAERRYWTAFANELFRTVMPLYTQAKEKLDQARLPSLDITEKGKLRQEGLEILKRFYEKRDQFLRRVDLWVNTLSQVYHQGMTSGRANPMLRWVLGPTEEHCRTCRSAHGQIHRASTWAAYNLEPQGDDLECGGWRCACGFEVVSGPAKGRIDRIPRFAAQKSLQNELTGEEDDDLPEAVEGADV